MIAINCCHTLLLMNSENTQISKKFNIVIHGASSFTGQIILEYFLENYPPNERLKWAISGRNYEKLNALLKKMISERSLDIKIPIIIADSYDRASIDDLTMSTDVILSTVGPYAKYGSELVLACAKNGTDYCDLAGETQWIQKMINKNQQIAEQTGARIIHACGFDSIPFDIGVFALQKYAIEKLGVPLKKVTTLVRAMRGGGPVEELLRAFLILSMKLRAIEIWQSQCLILMRSILQIKKQVQIRETKRLINIIVN